MLILFFSPLSTRPLLPGDIFTKGRRLVRSEKFWDALGVLDAAERSHFLPNCEPD